MAADGIDAVWITGDAMPSSWSTDDWDQPTAAVKAQFYGWEVESVAWLRPDHITVGRPFVAHSYSRAVMWGAGDLRARVEVTLGQLIRDR